MEKKIDASLKLAQENLFERLANLGFIVRKVGEPQLGERRPQIVFSVTTNLSSDHIEYFSLSKMEDNTIVLKEVDISGKNWFADILSTWLKLDYKAPIVEREFIQAA